MVLGPSAAAAGMEATKEVLRGRAARRNRKNAQHETEQKLVQGLLDPNLSNERLASLERQLEQRRHDRKMRGIRKAVAVTALVAAGVGGVGAAAYEWNKDFKSFVTSVLPKTTTHVDLQVAESVMDKVQLESKIEVAETHGQSTAELNASTTTCGAFGLICYTYAHEHAGGKEVGNVTETINPQAITLNAAQNKQGQYYVEATVDVNGISVQRTNTGWYPGGPQDGTVVQIFNASHIMDSDLTGRQDVAEAVTGNNLLAAGAAVLGRPTLSAAAVAFNVRNAILRPSAELVKSMDPNQAAALEDMAKNDIFVRFVTDERNTAGYEVPVADSSTELISVPVIHNQTSSGNLNISGLPELKFLSTLTTQTPDQTLLTNKAVEQIEDIAKTVQYTAEDGGWYIVGPQNA